MVVLNRSKSCCVRRNGCFELTELHWKSKFMYVVNALLRGLMKYVTGHPPTIVGFKTAESNGIAGKL